MAAWASGAIYAHWVAAQAAKFSKLMNRSGFGADRPRGREMLRGRLGPRGFQAPGWMNCICVPASSITSPLRRAMDSPVSGAPLTVGRAAPSTWANT